MTSILKNKIFAILFLVPLGLFFSPVYAQQETSQTLSVSPTLFQMSANPQQKWESVVRVINVNNYDITVYPEVVNFAPTGETGRGNLIPVFTSETKGQTLAEWVTLSSSTVVIPKQQTVSIPFVVNVPESAAPGGHYAAIMVGTKPQSNSGETSQVQTAQFVTSLLFIKVAGDVIENGNIREFTTDKSVVSIPEISFDLRFENTGNVHLQPQGDITIYNMWGSQRGVVPINYQTHFGNVLPKSIRKFSFTWTGEKSLSEIGRFKAVTTLGYGDEEKKFSTATTYFWVIPFQQILIFIFIAGIIFWFFSFAIKLYIKKVLIMSGLNPTDYAKFNNEQKAKNLPKDTDPSPTGFWSRFKSFFAPMRYGFLDLKKNLNLAGNLSEYLKIFFRFAFRQKLFVLFIGGVLCVIVALIVFVSSIFKTDTLFDVTIVNPDSNITISSEQMYYDDLPDIERVNPEDRVKKQNFTLEVINASGIPGVAAKTQKKLESYDYKITSLSNELDRNDTKTVIVYNKENQEEALLLSKILDKALLSADPDSVKDTIKVYVGSDIK